MSRKSPWQHLQDHPPALVRLFARRRTPDGVLTVMTLQEIAIASGITLARVREISTQIDWSGVTVEEAQRFIAGCAFDPLSYRDRNRKAAYTRKCPKFRYLKASPLWKNELAPLIFRLRSKMNAA